MIFFLTCLTKIFSTKVNAAFKTENGKPYAVLRSDTDMKVEDISLVANNDMTENGGWYAYSGGSGTINYANSVENKYMKKNKNYRLELESLAVDKCYSFVVRSEDGNVSHTDSAFFYLNENEEYKFSLEKKESKNDLTKVTLKSDKNNNDDHMWVLYTALGVLGIVILSVIFVVVVKNSN